MDAYADPELERTLELKAGIVRQAFGLGGNAPKTVLHEVANQCFAEMKIQNALAMARECCAVAAATLSTYPESTRYAAETFEAWASSELSLPTLDNTCWEREMALQRQTHAAGAINGGVPSVKQGFSGACPDDKVHALLPDICSVLVALMVAAQKNFVDFPTNDVAVDGSATALLATSLPVRLVACAAIHLFFASACDVNVDQAAVAGTTMRRYKTYQDQLEALQRQRIPLDSDHTGVVAYNANVSTPHVDPDDKTTIAQCAILKIRATCAQVNAGRGEEEEEEVILLA